MKPEQAADASSAAAPKATSSLKAAAETSKDAAAAAAAHAGGIAVPAPRDLSVRIGELVIFLLAAIGAVALGLGISDYFAAHAYIAVYLLAYGAFRIADLLVRDEAMLGTDHVCFARRIMLELPVLALFAGAPLERTYLYGGEAPNWLAGLGILIELIGLWLALGARIQLGFFSVAVPPGTVRTIVKNGLYRYIRHPIYAGEFLVLFAWPFEYAAPLTAIVMLLVGLVVMLRRIAEEETEMLANFGDDYAEYIRTTDRLIPNVW